jgi:hypothetical protein
LKRLLRIPKEYCDAIPIGERLFSPLFQFENGLRLAVHRFLTMCYGIDWWDMSIKKRLPDIYKYAENQKSKMDMMPWIGDSASVTVLPIHLVTLGQLEEIVKEYRTECIPDLFPNMEFFLGHMECIKRVRNLYAHMFPCLTRKDSQLARREIITLSSHINARL